MYTVPVPGKKQFLTKDEHLEAHKGSCGGARNRYII